jgi:elongation factor 1-gamma
MKIFSVLPSSRSKKALVAAHIAEVKVEHVHQDFSKLKEKEFLAKNPNGKIPVMETSPGHYLFESNAILRYIGRLGKAKGLYGADDLEASHVDQWLDWGSNELEPHVGKLIYPIFGMMPLDQETNKKAFGDAQKALIILDHHLKTRTVLVGDKVTVADIALASGLWYAFKLFYDGNMRKAFQNVTKWFEHICAQEAFVQIFGKTRLCVKTMPYPAQPAHEEKKEEPKKGHGKKDEPKKEEKKPEKKAEKKEDHDEDDEPKEKKEKSALDSLPPSTFNLFDFKTLFVNAPNKQEALDFFWKNYDAAGYSLYFVQYIKAEGEGKVLW